MAPKFALQNVLDVHRNRVEALEIQLSRLLGFKRDAETLLDKLQSGKDEIIRKLENAQVGDIDLFEISTLRSNILVMDRRIETVLAELARLEEAISEKRKELVAAKQDEEVLQILKRKGIENYNAEIILQEARIQDDIYIAQAFRQRGEGA